VPLVTPLQSEKEEVDQSAVYENYVRLEARKAGISERLALYIWTHEGGNDLNAIGDMKLTCKTGLNKGKPVRAKGGWQFTDCGHPEISDTCAFDLRCATTQALPLLKIKETCISQFSTCKDFYEKELQ
jgi:hypothetical protein